MVHLNRAKSGTDVTYATIYKGVFSFGVSHQILYRVSHGVFVH